MHHEWSSSIRVLPPVTLFFAMIKVEKINFEDPEKAKHKVSFDNLTPLYPDERLKMEIEDPTIKDRSARVIDLLRELVHAQHQTVVMVTHDPDSAAAADRTISMRDGLIFYDTAAAAGVS